MFVAQKDTSLLEMEPESEMIDRLPTSNSLSLLQYHHHHHNHNQCLIMIAVVVSVIVELLQVVWRAAAPEEASHGAREADLSRIE